MKCEECNNTSKFYAPIVGYQIEFYDNGQLIDTKHAHIEDDTDRAVLCAFCDGKVERVNA
jgi:hypothetical protein